MPTIHVVGALSDLLIGKESPVKYEDPGNPIVIVKISGHSFPNTLVNLWASINILTMGTCENLGISTLEPTATLLELPDRSVIKAKGTVQDILVSVDSWEYPADFLVINPNNRMDGHPLILGRTWLAITDAYIGRRTGCMTITRGDFIKNIITYLPTKPSLPMVKIHKHPCTYWDKNIRSPLTLVEALEFKDQIEDDIINNFMSQPPTSENLKCQMLKTVLKDEFQEDPLTYLESQYIPTTDVCNSIPIENEPWKILNINGNLDSDQKQRLIKFL